MGIEIGGTKLQLGVGSGDGSPLVELIRVDVEANRGAAGILAQIDAAGQELFGRHDITAVGIGFGGPVDGRAGRVLKSHQIAGWEGVPLVQRCEDQWGIRTVLGNDCDVAALAEARFGAGRTKRTVFYVTVGTGIGGGLVIDGELHGHGRPAAAEIGHLRVGPPATSAEATVESIGSGRGIEFSVRQQIQAAGSDTRSATSDLIAACGGDIGGISTQEIAAAAVRGNQLAHSAIQEACRVLGWAIAQVVTLLAAEVIVVGGGVSLIGEEQFFAPLRRAVAEYVFPPLQGSYQIVPAELGEEVVVHGATILARNL